jgi:hypothetical protein
MLYGGTAGDEGGDSGGGGDTGMFLHVGLSNGVLMRTEVDRTTGGAAFLCTNILARGPCWCIFERGGHCQPG